MSSYFSYIDDEEYGALPQYSGLYKAKIYPGLWDPLKENPYVGLYFRDKEMLIKGIGEWAISNNVHLKVYISNKTQYDVRCKLRKQDKNTKEDLPGTCLWRLRATYNIAARMFKVTRYEGPHTCTFPTIPKYHPQLTSTVIARCIENSISVNPLMRIPDVQSFILGVYKKQISYKRAWMGKQKAIAASFGDWDESYKTLPKFMAAIRAENPGSYVNYKSLAPTDEGAVLKRVFFTFGPLVHAFIHCKPVITIDATFLFGKYKEKLLIAMASDADNHILPIAFAFCDEESAANWSYFLRKLKDHVIKGRKEGMCLISDRHQGILAAVRKEWDHVPGYVHRYCARHFLENFKNEKDHQGKVLHQLAYDVIWEHQEKKYLHLMTKIFELNPQAHIWLTGVRTEKWACCYDGGRRYGAMTSNMAEIFNNVLRAARVMPITACVQLIFYKVVAWFKRRRVHVQNMMMDRTPFGKNIQEIISSRQMDAGHYVMTYNGTDGIYSVTTGNYRNRGGNVHVIRAKEELCDCGKWTAMHIPCSHYFAVTRELRLDWFQSIIN